jgi:hypothetical protein
VLADHVSIVVAEVDAVARAEPTRASGRAILVAAAAPRVGVTKVGLLVNATVPEPASSVNAAARFEEDGVARNVATPVPRPEIPVATGRPVAFVKVPADGVPRSGVVNVGDVSVLFVRVCVPVNVTTVESISRVFPVLSNPVPATICPKPVN